jgi:hypothetical protein
MSLRFVLALLVIASLPAAEVPHVIVPRSSQAPAVTADPADPAWTGIPGIPLGPVEDAASGTVLPQTTIQLQWQPQALHVRFTNRDDEIFAPQHGRDAPLFQADAVEAFIDPVGDGRAVYEFQVSPHADVFDQLILATAPEMRWLANGIWDIPACETWFMLEWNCAGVHQAARQVPSGWIADLAIPAEVLRRSDRTAFAPGELRAHLVRVDYKLTAAGSRLFTSASLAPYPNGNPHRTASRMAKLTLQE